MKDIKSNMDAKDAGIIIVLKVLITCIHVMKLKEYKKLQCLTVIP